MPRPLRRRLLNLLFCRIYELKNFEMKQIFLMIVLVAFGLTATSAYNEDRFGTAPGDLAAPVELKNQRSQTSLSDFRGKYVLLSFWSSEDAASRTLCKRYDAWQKSAERPATVHLSVNLDSNRALFDAIVSADNLDAASQYNLTGEAAAKVRRDYHLTENLGTLLIDPEGRIAAVNPDIARLASL